MDDISVNSFRGSLLFEPSDDVSIRLTAETYQKRGGSIPNKLVYATDPNEQIFITPDPWTQFSSIDGHEPMDSDSYTMKIDWQTGLGLVESLTNFRDTEYDWNQNSTGNLYPDGILYAMAEQIWFSFDGGTRCNTPFFPDGNCWASTNQTDGDGRGGIYFEQTSIEEVEQWSQEFRLSSQNDGTFNWFGGVFFANEKVVRQDISKFAIRFGPGTQGPCFPCPGGGVNVHGSWNEGTENIGGLVDADIFGAFVGFDIDFSDTLSLSISTRYSKDDKTFTSTKSGRVLNACACTTLPDGTETASWHPVPSQEWTDNIGTPLEGTPTPDNATAAVVPVAFGETDDWDNLSSRISLNLRLSDSVFLYGLISEGYKGGGWEGRAASGQTELIDTKFDEETAINYEVGLKADFWDRRARLNITGFFTEYDDLQMTILKPVFDPVSGTVIDSNAFTTNVGKAQASGAELEFAFLPFDGMIISGSYGYLTTEIQDDVFLTVDPGDPDDQINDPATVENLNGNELARAPESSYNVNANYTWEMGGGGSASLLVEYNWTEGNWATNRNHLFQPDQNFLDASFKYVSSSGQWEVMLWGRNLTDELNLNNLIFSGDTTENFDTLLLYHDYADPRTYGVAFTWNYQ
jgi:iron complex outermembrane receptor protein